VLVLALPPQIPTGGGYTLARASQIFDGNQFSAVYALRGGGFVSNTFFNGPLLPRHPTRIPPYWWQEFRPEPWLRKHCADLRHTYDTLLIWGDGAGALDAALRACGATPVARAGVMVIWRWGSASSA
jgi:hypothetical protein